MIKSIELENFKAFKKSGEVDLNKINIFVGPNSSGKSSFIKALLTLKNTLDSADEDMVLDLNENIGNFKSVVFEKNIKNTIKFKLNFNQKQYSSNKFKLNDSIFKIVNILEKLDDEELDIKHYVVELNKIYRNKIIKSIEFSIKITKSERVVVEEFTINYEDTDVTRIKMIRNSYYMYFNDKEIKEANIVKPYKFIFKVNDSKISRKLSIDELKYIALFEYAMFDIKEYLNEFTSNVRHIEPLRNKFNRVEYVTNLKFNNTVGKTGENTITTLVGLDKVSKEESNILHTSQEINRWMKEFDLGESISIKKLGNSNYSLFIKNKNTGIDCNILDMGVGTSQLLPIIIESINSPDNSILIIEEPESHIHPNAQSKLAELFVNVVSHGNKRFIIETHSLFLIIQLQILIAKKEIDSEDVNIYYFEQSQDGTKAKKMSIAQNGQFEEQWPSGFFDVQLQLGKLLFESI